MSLKGKKRKRDGPEEVDSLKEDEKVGTSVAPVKRRRLALLPKSSTIYKTESEPGNGGFHEITSLYNLIAADKTRYIELLDHTPKYSYMFLRPRRWGKSTFLQTLTDYYDKTKKDSFNDIFGDLYIGKHPTADRNRLLVLRFDFSEVSGADTNEGIEKSFNRM
ncbi:600_t:CDS:2, partial [Acaulospora colombiana]